VRLGHWVGFLALVLSLYILWRIRQVLLLAFTAVVLATVLNQLVKRLERGGLHRGFGILISVTALLILFAILVALIIPPFFDQLPQLINAIPQGLDQLRVWFKELSERIPGQTGDDVGILTRLTQQLPDFISQLFGNFYGLFTNSIEIILSLLLILVVTIMLLASPGSYRRAFLLVFPRFYRRRVDNILAECEIALTGWLIGILFNMTVIGVFSGLGLWLLGVPLPLANASLAGLLTFIPNLGPTLSVIPPTALALLDAPWKALAVVGLYVLIQQVESNILTPLVMRHQVSLLPAVTLLSQLAFSIFFGFMGLLLALPLLVVAQVCLKEVLVEDVMNDWEEGTEN
jgi:predicted PurR-regulated permease PerM